MCVCVRMLVKMQLDVFLTLQGFEGQMIPFSVGKLINDFMIGDLDLAVRILLNLLETGNSSF